MCVSKVNWQTSWAYNLRFFSSTLIIPRSETVQAPHQTTKPQNPARRIASVWYGDTGSVTNLVVSIVIHSRGVKRTHCGDVINSVVMSQVLSTTELISLPFEALWKICFQSFHDTFPCKNYKQIHADLFVFLFWFSLGFSPGFEIWGSQRIFKNVLSRRKNLLLNVRHFPTTCCIFVQPKL